MQVSRLEQVLSNHKRLALEYRSAAPGEDCSGQSRGGDTGHRLAGEREDTGPGLVSLCPRRHPPASHHTSLSVPSLSLRKTEIKLTKNVEN